MKDFLKQNIYLSLANERVKWAHEVVGLGLGS